MPNTYAKYAISVIKIRINLYTDKSVNYAELNICNLNNKQTKNCINVIFFFDYNQEI